MRVEQERFTDRAVNALDRSSRESSTLGALNLSDMRALNRLSNASTERDYLPNLTVREQQNEESGVINGGEKVKMSSPAIDSKDPHQPGEGRSLSNGVSNLREPDKNPGIFDELMRNRNSRPETFEHPTEPFCVMPEEQFHIS